MKFIYLYALMLVAIFAGCAKENNTPTIILDEMIRSDFATASNLKYTGNFSNGPYGTVAGTAKIYLQENKYTLSFENIAVSNGPDLHVYLSREMQPLTFIDLGKLKSTQGNQLYDVTGLPDFSQYTYVLIHCQQYNHLFGSAALK
ncbi:MAG: DM13 domain-containing protein [Chitinophagaceae bacterium]